MRRLALAFLASAFLALPVAAQDAVVEVLPRHPSSRDAIEFRVTGAAAICWPAALTLEPPRVAGEVVTLSALTPPGPLPPGCSPGWPQSFALANLAPGAYSAEFRLDGSVRGASAFEVGTPAEALELQGGSMLVTLSFHDRHRGVEHAATAVPLSDQSGFFWFFEPGNVEVTVKILDGRALNGAFWLFVASMTDVGYRLEVRRNFVACAAAPCETRRYVAPAGKNRNFIDTGLFAE
jgi:hypothetical protein